MQSHHYIGSCLPLDDSSSVCTYVRDQVSSGRHLLLGNNSLKISSILTLKFTPNKRESKTTRWRHFYRTKTYEHGSYIDRPGTSEPQHHSYDARSP